MPHARLLLSGANCSTEAVYRPSFCPTRSKMDILRTAIARLDADKDYWQKLFKSLKKDYKWVSENDGALLKRFKKNSLYVFFLNFFEIRIFVFFEIRRKTSKVCNFLFWRDITLKSAPIDSFLDFAFFDLFLGTLRPVFVRQKTPFHLYMR